MAPSVLVNVSVHVWEISVEAHNRMPFVRGFAGVLAGSECFVTLIRTAGEFPQELCRLVLRSPSEHVLTVEHVLTAQHVMTVEHVLTDATKGMCSRRRPRSCGAK